VTPRTCGRADELPLVGVITIWYRAGGEVARYVADLAALDYPRLQPVFVIHDQTQEEVAQLRASVPRAWILQPQSNLGSAAGWNLAIERLLDRGVDYIVILNTDVRFEPHCIGRLVEVMMGDPSIGACQPLILYSDEPDTVEMYGGSVDLRNGRIEHEYEGVTTVEELPPVRDAEYLDGGTIFLRADAIRQTGGFDEQFFLYVEDTDLSLRLQRLGYRTVAVRDARAWHFHREHYGRFPTPYQVFYQTRNRLYLIRKHARRGIWFWFVARTLMGAPRGIVHYLRRRKFVLAQAYAAGVSDGLAARMGIRGWLA
jgi:GT2 family glycosyltransferase